MRRDRRGVMVSLRASSACAAEAAICTPEGRPQSSSLSVTVAEQPAPVGVSGAVLAFAVTLSRAASRAVPVDVTSDGSAQAGEELR